MADDYAKRQMRKDAAHTHEYSAWIASLPPEERRRMAELGLAEPLREADGYGWGKTDAAEFHEASEKPKLPIEAEELPVNGAAIENEAVLDILRRLIGELLAERNARLSLVPRARHRLFLPRRHDDRHRPAALRHPRGREQTLRGTDRTAAPASVARDALLDSTPRISGRPALNPHQP